MSDDECYVSPRDRDIYNPPYPGSPQRDDDSDASDEYYSREEKMQAKTGALLLGALMMADENPYKSLVLPAAERLYQRAIAEKCEHCQNSLPSHYYQCPLATKCPSCHVRTDLADVSHKSTCKWRPESSRAAHSTRATTMQPMLSAPERTQDAQRPQDARRSQDVGAKQARGARVKHRPMAATKATPATAAKKTIGQETPQISSLDEFPPLSKQAKG